MWRTGLRQGLVAFRAGAPSEKIVARGYLEGNSTAGIPSLSRVLFNSGMKTIEEVRHDWLLRLIGRFGTVAELNAALGRTRTDATLIQIKNRAPNTRSGKPRCMGSALAREIERKLGLEHGLLDHPPAPAIPAPRKCGDEVLNALADAILEIDKPPPPWVSLPAIRFLVGMTREARKV
jgi:hypothetical protein